MLTTHINQDLTNLSDMVFGVFIFEFGFKGTCEIFFGQQLHLALYALA